MTGRSFMAHDVVRGQLAWQGEAIGAPAAEWECLPRRRGMGLVKWMGKGTLDGYAVYVKRGRAARPQAAADALKPAFGLRPMGTVWWRAGGEDWVAMRVHPTLGTLKAHPHAVTWVEVARDLGRVLRFDLATANRDRNLANLLVHPDGGLLAVDEPWAFQYGKAWKPRMPWAVAAWGLLLLDPAAVDPAELEAACERVAAQTQLPAVREVPAVLAANATRLTRALWQDPPHRLDLGQPAHRPSSHPTVPVPGPECALAPAGSTEGGRSTRRTGRRST